MSCCLISQTEIGDYFDYNCMVVLAVGLNFTFEHAIQHMILRAILSLYFFHETELLLLI